MRKMKLSTLPVFALLIWSCVSKTTGNEGNFEFSYQADDRIGDFNKPIAVGARLDLEVRDVGDRQPVDLSSAAFDDSSILEVVSRDGHKLTIQANSEGNVLLEVAGTSNGEALTDSVNLLARVPEVVKLRHTCDSSGSAVYLASQRVSIPFDMEMSNSQPVIGYGYYPATASDTTAMTLDESASTQQLMVFDSGSTAAQITLDSDLDETSLDIRIATESEINGVQEPTAWVLEDIDVGDINSFYVRPLVDTLTVCQGNATKTVRSDTPSICNVTDREPENGQGDLAYEYGWFQVEGLAAGTCMYTVAFTGGNAGNGASEQFSYPIEP